MNYREIKILLIQHGLTVRKLAEAINERPTAVTQTITYARPYLRIRQKIAAYFNKRVDEIFDASIQCGPINPPKTRSAEAA
ncbi:MAG: hypothetical protein WBV94_24750 [Blastocatellia bacterium]